MRRESWCPQEPQTRTSATPSTLQLTDADAFIMLKETVDGLNTDLDDMQKWGGEVYDCACTEIEKLHEKIKELEDAESDLLRKLSDLEYDISNLETIVDTLSEEKDDLSSEVDRLQSRLDDQ